MDSSASNSSQNDNNVEFVRNKKPRLIHNDGESKEQEEEEDSPPGLTSDIRQISETDNISEIAPPKQSK